MTTDIQTIIRQGVRERDLDHFLVEELQAAPEFRAWFLAQLPSTFEPPPFAQIQLEKSPARLQDSRQTDVRIGWFDESSTLLACVLIECKVTADFQPGQVESYRDELAALRSVLGAGRAAMVLVAPSGRLATLGRAAEFCATVSIEDMIDALSARRSGAVMNDEVSVRLAVRIGLLDSIRSRRSQTEWTPVTLPEKRRFADGYADLAREVVPHLSVRPSTDGPNALTRFFDGLGVERSFPCGVKLKHEFGSNESRKYANLQFNGAAARLPALRARGDLFMGGRLAPVASGKALFVRIETPGLVLNILQFDRQRDKIIEGLKAIGELAEWFSTHQRTLRTLLSD
jgi:hypothetical protein